MSDRLQELRARLDAWKRQTDAMEAWEKLPKADRPKFGYHVAAACGCGDQRCGTSDEWYPVWYHEGEVYEHATADIAWLLDEVERLQDIQERNMPWWRRDADGSLWAAPPTVDGAPEPDSDKWVRVQ